FCLFELRVFETFLDILRSICSGHGCPTQGAANTSCPSSDRFRLRELRESQHFSTFYGPSVQSMDTQLGVRQGRWTPAGSPRSSSTFREGGLEGRREWNPRSPGEPGPRRGGPLIATPSRSNLSAPGLRPANARYQTNAMAQESA